MFPGEYAAAPHVASGVEMLLHLFYLELFPLAATAAF
jgi:hypothetical protein